MYTQCPECSSAFRVTAEVLKVAAGMVRCGSCGHAFNSLDFLSEEKPRPKKPELNLPELRPEPDEEASFEDPTPEVEAPADARPKGPPQSISAEHSAALLKTLDQLAGEDVRIEDTGVEWRVLDDEPELEAEAQQDESSESELLNDPEVTNAFFVGDIERYQVAQDVENAVNVQAGVDESLDAGETIVDEDLSDDAHSDTQVELDAHIADVFGEPAATENEPYTATGVSDADIFNPLQTHVDEILDDSATPIHELVAPEPEAQAAAPIEEAEEEVLRFDDNTPLPDDFLDDEPVAAAVEEPQPSIDDSQSFDASITLGNPDEWQQLLDDFDDLLAGAPDTDSDSRQDEEDDWAGAAADAAAARLAVPDTTHHFDTLETGNNTEPVAADEAVVAPDETPIDEFSGDNWEALPALADDLATSQEDEDEFDPSELDDLAEQADEAWESLSAESAQDLPQQGSDDDPIEHGDSTDVVDETEHADGDLADLEPVAITDSSGALDVSQILDPDEDNPVENGTADPAQDDVDLPEMLSLDDDAETAEDSPDGRHTENEAGDDFDLPPQSEEEQTINMLIDQDLLSIAREDEDGFTSTIVFEEGVDPLAVSSITMQGEDLIEETILSAEDDPLDPVSPEGTSLFGGEPTNEAPTDAGAKKTFYRLAAAAVLLALALGGQMIHQQREQLATNPTVLALLAPVYATFGVSLKPNWDVSGWTIERTQGATDGTDELLTIISELRNRSEKPLPYPIITVSLTDRSQDPVGSLVVEPKDYLSEMGANGEMVAGGMQFQARIPVDAPPIDASGYTINACYRVSGSQLRCANEDFLR